MIKAHAFLIFLFLLFLPMRALAVEEEHSVAVGLASNFNASNALYGAGVVAQYRYDVDDTFSFGGGLELTFDRCGEQKYCPQTYTGLYALKGGISYSVDILAVIPYLSLDAVLYVSDSKIFERGHYAAGLDFSFALDWRFRRSQSLGLAAVYHFLFTDRNGFPAFLSFNLFWKWHSDPFDF